MNYEDIKAEMGEMPVEKVSEVDGSDRYRTMEIDGVTLQNIPVVDSFEATKSFADYFHGKGAASLALQAAGLHYPLRMVPLALSTGEYSPNCGEFSAIVNEKGRVLGRPVTNKYHMAQNATVAAMMDELCEGKMPEDIMIKSWGGGERLAIRVPVTMGIEDYTEEELEIVRKRRAMFNKIHNWVDSAKHPDLVPPQNAYITLQNAHGTLGKLIASMELRFTACDNGVVEELIRNGFSFRHSALMEERIKQAQRAFVLARGNALVWRDLTATLFSKPMNATQFTAYMDSLFPIPEEKKGKAMTFWEADRAEFERIYQKANGAAPGTLFGALQAATYWNTHAAGVKVGSQIKKYKLDGDVAQIEETARYGLILHGRARDFQDQAVQQVVMMLD